MVILQTLQCLRLHSDEFVNNRQIKKIMALLTKTTRNYIHDWRRHFRDSQLSPLEYVSEASALLQLKIGSSFAVHETKHCNRWTRPPHYALVLRSLCKLAQQCHGRIRRLECAPGASNWRHHRRCGIAHLLAPPFIWSVEAPPRYCADGPPSNHDFCWLFTRRLHWRQVFVVSFNYAATRAR